MAKAGGSFETIVGAYFDEVILPVGSEPKPMTTEERNGTRGKFIATAAKSEHLILSIEEHYGVSIY